MKNLQYSIITPLKNEEKHLKNVIFSVLKQKQRPLEWIIINDFSTDRSLEILENCLSDVDFVNVVNYPHNNNEGYSSRVVTLFNYGISKISKPVDIICKFDADIEFDSDFCTSIINEFEKNEKLGICSGTMIYKNKIDKERFPTLFTRGATKFYNYKCFLDIGGLVNFYSWDTFDNSAARAKGWQTLMAPFYFIHLKEEGSRVGTRIKQHYLSGFANGAIPYTNIYFLLKLFKNIFTKPFFVGSLFQLIGFVKAKYIFRIRPIPGFISEQVTKEQKIILKSLLGL